ncbi:hypothetical protein DBR44_04100 [Aquitalea sp. FJL05]|uniref:DNA-binding protein n=1 Tax=Aquitalea sp. FJL05 TaxID=2153366 RepID=UPI000F5AEFAF|nr:DNA-binding protein [Aquitalea sp. FJL05]RQO76864.1 hypothetical protein DBR44_04100 [Aquitalea sp. FJL05]
MSQAACIPADVRERIQSLASLLYQQNDQQCFPLLDEVSRLAGVDMNVTSQVFMEWRMSQRAHMAPLPQDLPAEFKEIAGLVLDRTWQQARQLANQYLQSAQVAWEDDRQEWLAEQRDLALLCEQQAQELDALRQHLSKVLGLNAQQQQPNASPLTAAVRDVLQDERVLQLQQQLDDARQGWAEAEQALHQMREQAQSAATPLPPLVLQDERVPALQQEVDALRSQLTQSEQEADLAKQQQLQAQEEVDELQHKLEQMQEELRTLRSDKESAYRAVANLRQQLQQLKQIQLATPEEQAERLERLKTVAFSPSLPGQLSSADAEQADQIWKAR